MCWGVVDSKHPRGGLGEHGPLCESDCCGAQYHHTTPGIPGPDQASMPRTLTGKLQSCGTASVTQQLAIVA